MADVVVLNYNDAETTEAFVRQVCRYDSVRHIMIVDNASTDDSVKRLSALECGKVRLVVSPVNGGYGAGNNLGIRELFREFGSEYILLSNPDVIIDNKAIEATEDFLRSHSEYALAAPYMCKPDGTRTENSANRISKWYQYALTLGVIYAKFRHPGRYAGLSEIREPVLDVGFLAGSCFMMNTKLMIEHGMFDENMFLFCEEVVLGIKMRDAGYKTALLTSETFIHNHSVSINKSLRSEVKKKKILVKSKLYVLEHYYKVRRIPMLFARVLAVISVGEAAVMSFLRNR